MKYKASLKLVVEKVLEEFVTKLDDPPIIPARDRIMEAAEREKEEIYYKVAQALSIQKKEIIEELEKKAKITPPEFQEAGRFARNDWENIGFNNALDQAIKVIKKI